MHVLPIPIACQSKSHVFVLLVHSSHARLAKMAKSGLTVVVLVRNDVIPHLASFVLTCVWLDVSVRRVVYWMHLITVLNWRLALLFLQWDATEHHVE